MPNIVFEKTLHLSKSPTGRCRIITSSSQSYLVHVFMGAHRGRNSMWFPLHRMFWMIRPTWESCYYQEWFRIAPHSILSGKKLFTNYVFTKFQIIFNNKYSILISPLPQGYWLLKFRSSHRLLTGSRSFSLTSMLLGKFALWYNINKLQEIITSLPVPCVVEAYSRTLTCHPNIFQICSIKFVFFSGRDIGWR